MFRQAVQAFAMKITRRVLYKCLAARFRADERDGLPVMPRREI
jgi:hypothetical protein